MPVRRGKLKEQKIKARWSEDQIIHAFKPRQKPLPAPVSGIFDAPYVCVKINEQWLPHIVPMLDVLDQGDAWQGDTDTQYSARHQIRRLIDALADNSGCSLENTVDDLRFRLTAACVMQFSTDAGINWQDVTDWSINALACFQGEPGEPGEQGEPGTPGAPGQDGQDGEDCECGPVPPQPPIPPEPEDDCDQRNCNVAFGVGTWLHAIFDDSLEFIVAGVDAAQAIETIISGIIDAFPVLGAVVDAILDFVTETIQAGAQETLAANGNYFKEMIQCELYCIMKCDCGEMTTAYFEQVKDELQTWANALPPQTPLLVIIGQIFAAWLETVPAEELLRRANIYKNAEADCSLCEDCDPCCEEIEKTFPFNNSSEGYSIINGTQDTGLILGAVGSSVGYEGYPDLPSQPNNGTNRVAIVRVSLKCLVNRVNVAYNFLRTNSGNSTVSVVVYLYDEDNVRIGTIGGSYTNQQQNTNLSRFIDVGGTTPVCVDYALILIGFADSTTANPHAKLLEFSTSLTQN